MNSLDLTVWLTFLTKIGIQVGAVLIFAIALHCTTRSRSLKRAIWQSALVCSILLTVFESSGGIRGIAVWLFAKPAPTPHTITRVLHTAPGVDDVPRESMLPAPQQAAVAIVLPGNCWWPALLWAFGVGTLLMRIVWVQGLFFLLRRNRQRLDALSLGKNVAKLCASLRLRRKVRLLELPGITSPVAFGILRPCIGLPAGFHKNFTPAQQQAMLAHELAHLRAHDPAWYLVADLVTAVLWWHPAVWGMRRQLHLASEFAADEAVGVLENGHVTLAECLATLGRQLTAPNPTHIGVRGFRSNLGKRVEALLNSSNQRAHRPERWPQVATKFSMPVFMLAVLICTFGWFESRGLEKSATLSASVQSAWGDSMVMQGLAAAREARELRTQVVDTRQMKLAPTTIVRSSASAHETLRKLETIRIQRLYLADGTLAQALESITAQLPTEDRVPFSLNVTNSVRVKVDPALTNLTLQGAIRAIMTVADKPIGYAVTSKGVVEFMERRSPPLYSERIPIDLEAFRNALISSGFDIPSGFSQYAEKDLAKFFLLRGSRLSEHATLSIHARPNVLHVSGTPGDVEAVNEVVQKWRTAVSDLVEVKDPPQLFTRVFAVDLKTLMERVAAAGFSVEQGGEAVAFNTTRPIGDFPRVNRGPDLQILDGTGFENRGPRREWNGLNFVTKTNQARNINNSLRRYFESKGINLDPPESLFLNDRSNQLIVRATLHDLEAVAKLIPTNAPLPLPRMRLREVKSEREDLRPGAFDGAIPRQSPPP